MKDLITINKLIESFNILPGVGKKTAERYTFFLINHKNKSKILFLAQNLQNLIKNIKKCHICNHITEKNICYFCSDSRRNKNIMMIVADSRDVFCFEKTKIFNGIYHILGGLIDFSNFVKPENLNLTSLKNRLSNIKEIIIATNSTFEGECTAKYLKNFVQKYNQLKASNIKITRLAYGIPIGLEFDYIDEKTLYNAVNNRNIFVEGDKEI